MDTLSRTTPFRLNHKDSEHSLSTLRSSKSVNQPNASSSSVLFLTESSSAEMKPSQNVQFGVEEMVEIPGRKPGDQDTLFFPKIKFLGYASVRPFLYFDHFHIFGLFCTSTALLRPLYFDLFTSTCLLRPFVKSGLLIGREAQVEVQFWSK